MMYKDGPYYAEGSERVYKHLEPNGGSIIQYYTGKSREVYSFWISQEEENLDHRTLAALAKAVLVLDGIVQ